MNPLNPKKLARDEKVAKAYEMALNCYSLSQIAYELGVCKTTAHNYVKEGKQITDKFHEDNLNYLREMRIQQIESLVRSRLDDLAQCRVPDDLEESENEDGEMLDPISIGKIRLYYMRDRSHIINDLAKLYQELSKLQGLYDTDRVEKFVTKKEANLNADIASMTDDELTQLFNDLQRDK